MAKKKVNIKDIAKMAGVSAGTVDRVLHNRGKVSDEALNKVKEVLTKFDYEPNLIARTLKNHKVYHVALMMPNPDNDPYWLKPRKAMGKAVEEYQSMGLSIDLYPFDPDSIDSFQSDTKRVIDSDPDAVFISPQFFHESLEFFNILKEKNIPYLTFNTHIDEANPLCHIGQDLRQSGRLAGNLIHLSQPGAGMILVLNIDENPANSACLQEKKEGFLSYFKDIKSENIIKRLDISNENPSIINEFINGHEPVTGVYITNSKSSEVIEVWTCNNKLDK